MAKKITPLFLVILSFIFTSSFCQSTGKSFEDFANGQDSLFSIAYENLDPKAYQKLLGEFLVKYNKLPEDSKKEYSDYLNSSYYNFACLYALSNNKEKAFEYLKKSISAGFYNYTHIMQDSDLVSIRDDNRFKTMVEPLRKIGDYLFILKKAGKYNDEENQKLPKFLYQSSGNPDLVALRKAFNLDSIAGEGNEVSQILNLMHWVHYLIPHDGNKPNPVIKNAMSMITECKKENRGLNCRGLAIVLNECYLSLGFKSRIVTCLPKDSLDLDPDCHVINAVYSESHKKWLWIDPTFNAYVMNEKGELLSIEEVRERLINDQPLIINPDANWNRKFSEEIDDYLYNYMAKNLYILESPVISEYNMETDEPEKVDSYIQLIPIDYFQQTPEKYQEINPASNAATVFYKTNNSALFWQAP